VNGINQITSEEVGDPETNARIHQYEMAFRMQTSLPELTDMRDEPDSTWTLYGDDAKQAGTFCLQLFASRAVWPNAVSDSRKIYQRGWDVHSNAVGNLPKTFLPRRIARSYALVNRFEAPRTPRRHARTLGRRIRPALFTARAAFPKTTMAATIILVALRSGWPEAAPNPESPTA